MYQIKDINESFAVVTSSNMDFYTEVMNLLTFISPNHKFDPKFRAGNWDGKRRFYRVFNSQLIIPKGIVDLIIKKLPQHNIEYISLDYSMHKISKIILPTFLEFKLYVKDLGLPFEPYDYQVKAAFDSIINRKQTNILATSAGKSVIIYIVSKWLYDNNLKTVIIVPSILLTTQLKSDFESYINVSKLNEEKQRLLSFWDDKDSSLIQDEIIEFNKKAGMFASFLNSIHLIGGDNKIKHFDSPVTITTWQSVYTSPELFKYIDAVIVDECHGVKASSFSDVIMPSAMNAVYRLGFTGTLPPNIIDKLEVISAMGSPKTYITAQDLIKRGLATPVEIVAVFLKYSKFDSIRISSYNKNYRKQLNFIYSLKSRQEVLAKLIKKLQTKGNVLILFNKLEIANSLICTMYPELFEIFGEGIVEQFKGITGTNKELNTFLINGSTKVKDRENVLKLLETTSNNVVFGTEKILSTGINAKNLHYIVNVSASGKSLITLIQSIGRLLRLHESKTIVKFYDIVDYPIEKEDNKCYPVEHWEERLEMYRNASYPLTSIEIQV